jgi:hypothetical protein
MCREYKQLPPLCTITDELRWVGGRPFGGGGTADVWRGVYQGSEVAIKVLRVSSGEDLASLEKVRPFIFVLYAKDAVCADESGTAILLRGGPMAPIQTPKLVTVAGGGENSRIPDNGFRVDGAWYHQGFYHRPPRDKPTEAGEYFSPRFDTMST